MERSHSVPLVLAGCALALLAATQAVADTYISDTNRTISRLGVQGSNAYFGVKEGFSVACRWGNVYVDITTDFGKAAYANLLAAKASGRVLSRVDYNQTVSADCTLAIVEIAD